MNCEHHWEIYSLITKRLGVFYMQAKQTTNQMHILKNWRLALEKQCKAGKERRLLLFCIMFNKLWNVFTLQQCGYKISLEKSIFSVPHCPNKCVQVILCHVKLLMHQDLWCIYGWIVVSYSTKNSTKTHLLAKCITSQSFLFFFVNSCALYYTTSGVMHWKQSRLSHY